MAVVAVLPTVQVAPGVDLPMITLGGINITLLPEYPHTSNYSLWLELGNRGFDTAWEYETQVSIRDAIAAKGLKRSDVFITTKIPCSVNGGQVKEGKYFPPYMTPDMARAHFQYDLQELQMDYVDLLLLHEHCNYYPPPRVDPGPYTAANETAAIWKVLEEAYANSSARAIGVSNFETIHLKALLKTANIMPVVNQCAMSVGSVDFDTLRFCQQHNITYQAYSPLHGYCASEQTPAIHSKAVKAVADAHGVSSAQVMLRWIVQHEVAIVTATNRSDYMHEDMHVFNFTLTDSEMNALDHCSPVGGHHESTLVV